jgi:hypothetical protein
MQIRKIFFGLIFFISVFGFCLYFSKFSFWWQLTICTIGSLFIFFYACYALYIGQIRLKGRLVKKEENPSLFIFGVVLYLGVGLILSFLTLFIFFATR